MSRRPTHLLFITADFFRGDFLSCHGHPRINTWYLDKLARDGCRFASCYAASPVTATARVSLLTSTRPGEHQVLGPGVATPPGLPHLFTELAAARFQLGLFGRPDGLPEGQLETLFAESHALAGVARDDLPEFTEPFVASPVPEGHPYQRAAAWTDAALGFLGRHATVPAAAWLSLAEPGPPYAIPPPYDFLFALDEVALPAGWPAPADRHEPARHAVWRTHAQSRRCDDEHLRRLISIYMGQIRLIDDQIGRIVRILNDTGRAEHTLLVFVGTHGDLLGHRGMFQNPPAFYEPAVHVPWLIRDPRGLAKGQVFDGLVETIDVVPTTLSLLGVEVPASMAGTSWARELQSKRTPGHTSVLVEGGIGAPALLAPIPGFAPRLAEGITLHGPGAMIRKDSWKLMVYSDDSGELYDLESDPLEQQNRFEDASVIDVREELMGDLARRLLAIKMRPGPPARPDLPDLRQSPVANAVSSPPAAISGRLELIRRRLAPSLPTKPKLTTPVKVTRAPFASATRERSLQQVLFVCTGNIYRSRFAEAFFNYFATILNLRWSACSRGLAVDQVNEDISRITLDALAEREIPLNHTAAQRQALALDDLQRADRIVLLDETEHRPLLTAQFPEWVDRVEYWDVGDLQHAPPHQSLARIEELATRLIRELDSPSR